MSIGNNIRIFREKANLSQDELAFKLDKNKETVVNWESDEEQPSIEDVMKLKDIFGVSADDIINEKRSAEPMPEESYEFYYSAEEMNMVWKVANQYHIVKAIIISAVLILLGLLSAIINQDFASFSMIAIVWIIYFITVVARNISNHKKWKKMYANIIDNSFCFDLFENYMNVSMKNKNGIINRQSIPYFTIKNWWDSGDFYIFEANGQIFTVKKNELNEISIFRSLSYDRSRKTKKLNHLQTAASVTLAGSILSLFAALMTLGIFVSDTGIEFLSYMWICWLFLPIPIASIIVGIILNNNNIKNKKNIVVGIIMVFLLSVYGSFSFIFSNVLKDSTEYIPRIEQELDVDIPDTLSNYTYTYDQTDDGISIAYTTYLFYDNRTMNVFISDIIENYEMLDYEQIYKYTDILPSEVFQTEYDCFMIYNVTKDEINKLPSEHGTNTYILLGYSSELGNVVVCEYSIYNVRGY